MWVCAIGLFLAGYLFYSSAYIQVIASAHFFSSAWVTGITQSLLPLGAILGTFIAGIIADRWGRQRLLSSIFFALIFTSLLGALFFNLYFLFCSRFILGLFAGGLYPTCAAYLTETNPRKVKQSVAIAMTLNCLAAPCVCLYTMILVPMCSEIMVARLLIFTVSLVALFAWFLSVRAKESAQWLICKDKFKKPVGEVFSLLFSKTYKNITISLMACWFLMDIAYYGINFFLPQLIKHLTSSPGGVGQTLTVPVLFACFLINLFFMLGAFTSVFIVEKVNLSKLQQHGFFISSLCFFILANCAYMGTTSDSLITIIFLIFSFSLNIGPDVTTYLLPAISYPVEIRATAHGSIAAIAKLGSFVGVLFLPLVEAVWGKEMVFLLLAFILLLAFFFTIQYKNQYTGPLAKGIYYEAD